MVLIQGPGSALEREVSGGEQKRHRPFTPGLEWDAADPQSLQESSLEKPWKERCVTIRRFLSIGHM